MTHVPLLHSADGLLIDDQTAAGIVQWSRHFSKVTYCGIQAAPGTERSTAWVPVSKLERCTVLSLPRAYRPLAMARRYRYVRQELSSLIARHRHLCFTIGSLVGDWPAIAALEARRQGRDYAAWIDGVVASINRERLRFAPGLKRRAGEVAQPLIERGVRQILAHSSVALLQGRDTFDYYQRSASTPHCTYDTHMQSADKITPADLAGKQTRALSGAPMNILYAGRAASLKGTSDWLDTLDHLQSLGVPFRAKWIGEGPDLATMRDRVALSPLAGHVTLMGFEANRQSLYAAMRQADIFLFCHLTAESPRSLMEALASGSPIIGYGSAYARDLVASHGGGTFVEKAECRELAGIVERLHANRDELARLIVAAAESGRQFTEDSVYAHRARLMKLA